MNIALPAQLSHNQKHHDAIASSTKRAAEALLAAQPKLPPLRAIVLTGAPARGEGTAISVGRAIWTLSDIDLIAVFDTGREVVASRPVLVGLGREVTQQLRSDGLASHVDFAPHTSASLRSLPASMFAMEFARFAKVILGDASVLDGVLQVDNGELPASDALALLTNRVVGQLVLQRDLSGTDPLLRAFAAYHSGKVACDVLAAYLCYARMYSPTYEERLKACEEQVLSRLGLDENMRQNAKRWTMFKLDPDATPDGHIITGIDPDDHKQRLSLWDQAGGWLVSAWQNLAAQFIGSGKGEPLPRLVTAVAAKESMSRRLWGWASLIRHPMLDRRRLRIGRLLAIAVGASPAMAASGGALLLMAGDHESARRLSFLKPRGDARDGGGKLQASIVEAWRLVMKGGGD